MSTLILHHTDNDGYCAGAIAYNARLSPTNDCYPAPINYHMQFPMEALRNQDLTEIIVVDFSFSNDQWEELMDWRGDEPGRSVHWIDHHVTAIDAAAGKPWGDLPGLRDRENTKAACLLAWEYFHGGGEVPLAVKLIDDRDRWAFKHQETSWFHAGVEAVMDVRINSHEWAAILRPSWDPVAGIIVNDMVMLGQRLLAKSMLTKLQKWEEYGFEFDLLGLKAQCLVGVRGSESFPPGGDADVLVTTNFDGTQWNTVLYHSDNRKDLDLSAIAKQFPGGGGHKGAAGLRSPHPPWDCRCWESIQITQEGA